jgi:hypothetical protein
MGGGANTLGVRTFGIIEFGRTIHAPELSSQTEKAPAFDRGKLGGGGAKPLRAAYVSRLLTLCAPRGEKPSTDVHEVGMGRP